ncbi:MAG: hypothetical protein WBP81_35035 [Solirubrobacteraceae bacterium]
MKKIVLLLLAGAALVAGCGSSGSSTATSKSTSGGATQSNAASGNAGSGGYAKSANTGSGSGAGAIVLSTKHSKLGTVLAAGPKHLTVYLFEADKGAHSSCSGACAAVWPPVTTSGKPHTSGAVLAGDLGTITRSAGVTQVTYKGHPLYYFVKDKDDGDAYGEGIKGFGAEWYVLAPSGNKIDES